MQFDLTLFGTTDFGTIHLHDEAKLVTASTAQCSVANANAQTASYVQTDVTTIVTLVNDLKSKYNQLQTEFSDLKTRVNGWLG